MRNTHIAFLRLCTQAAAIISLTFSLVQAQPSRPTITLVKPVGAQAVASQGNTAVASTSATGSAAVKENYREFASVKMGQSAEPEFFTLEFNGTTKITAIAASPDFHVFGGTCITGHTYAQGDVCNVEVVFTPQGPGHRAAQLTVVHSASVTPFLTPIGGTAFAPAVSFTPSLIATVPGTYLGTGVTGGGAFLNPQGLAIDGGDNLYIADTGNNLIKFRDSSGTISNIVGGGAASAVGYSGFGAGIKLNGPSGVAVDYAGTFYISDTGDSVVLVRYIDGIINTRIGGGATGASCSFASPCLPYNVKITPPYAVATDSSGNVYTTLKVGGSLPGFYIAENEADNNNYYLLNTTAYNYYSTSPSIAVDANSNLLYTYEDPGGPLLSPTPLCYILGQNRAYSTSAAGQRFWTVAGSGPCGFSGDGGRATGAEISKIIGQFAFDAAGNFYFADTGNNRIRRVDATTGIIRTVAGSGGGGIGGDNGPSTAAHVQSPTGLAVDSNGRIYTTGIAPGPAAPARADLRMFGTIGALNFGVLATASPSAALTVLVSNVGNDTLNITHAGFSSGNTGDFTVDPNTTTCNFTLPLYSGRSCYVGFIFKPTVVGTRSAIFTLADDTVNGLNTIQVTGTGATPAKASLSPTSLAFASQKVGTSSAAKTITLTNPGGVPLTINSYTFTGTNAAEFSQTHTCAASLAAATPCTIGVVFKPLAAGTRSATLSISTSAGTVAATLSGPSAAAVAVKPTVTLTSRVNPSPGGRPILLTSSVVADSTTKPGGSVQLKEGANVLAQASLANGIVTFSLRSLTPGSHMLSAVYLGDAKHPRSTSPAIKQVVAPNALTPLAGKL